MFNLLGHEIEITAVQRLSTEPWGMQMSSRWAVKRNQLKWTFSLESWARPPWVSPFWENFTEEQIKWKQFYFCSIHWFRKGVWLHTETIMSTSKSGGRGEQETTEKQPDEMELFHWDLSWFSELHLVLSMNTHKCFLIPLPLPLM